MKTKFPRSREQCIHVVNSSIYPQPVSKQAVKSKLEGTQGHLGHERNEDKYLDSQPEEESHDYEEDEYDAGSSVGQSLDVPLREDLP